MNLSIAMTRTNAPVIAIVTAIIATLFGAQVSNGDSVEHTLWEVSTRCNSKCIGAPDDQLPAYRFECGSWVPSSELELHRHVADQPATTVLFVHGNLTDTAWARSHAVNLFRKINQRAEAPIRLICVSWPSEVQRGIPLPAYWVREKKLLIKSNSFQLAYFLSRLGDGEPKGMIGFSFGGAIVAGALHLSAGGDIDGLILGQSPTVPATHVNVRLGFVAPAFDRTALTPYGEFSQTPLAFSKLISLHNSRDPVLRHFRIFDRSTPGAAGYWGLFDSKFEPLKTDQEAYGQIVQFDCCAAIGSTHAFMDYYYCPAFDVMLDNVLGQNRVVGRVADKSPSAHSPAPTLISNRR